MVQRLTTAKPESRLSLLWWSGGEVPDTLTDGDSVGVLFVIKFCICLAAIRELMPNNQTSPPTLGNGVTAKVITDLSI